MSSRVATFEKISKVKDADLAADVKKLLGLATADPATKDAAPATTSAPVAPSSSSAPATP